MLYSVPGERTIKRLSSNLVVKYGPQEFVTLNECRGMEFAGRFIAEVPRVGLAQQSYNAVS